jgi:hypothetical protein
MKNYNSYKSTVLPTKIFILFISLHVNAQLNATNKPAIKKTIHEENYILINGIEQWVTIHGDSTKPVVLFIHGGPGSPMSPYSNTLYAA